jgi:predicted RNA polymerase sigma factor
MWQGFNRAEDRHAGLPAALSAWGDLEVDTLTTELDDYHLFHATRAQLLRELDRTDQAADADRPAIALTANPAERSLLRQRLAWD